MQKELSIDLVKDEEIAILRDLAIQTFTETFGGHNTEQQLQEFFQEAYTTEILTQELKSEESLVYFLRLNGAIVGYLKVNWGKDQTEYELEDAFEIQRIYILNKYQGLGLGNYLFKFALKKAYESGKAWAWLGVWENNLKAQSLYRKYGFEKFSEHSFAVGDLVDTDWLMKKSLK
ncbi:GNAT family N-acetyltransferase [Streptococcus porcinus]|uniref:GNAT family N-acetyltransferase n=2 Tax=Streptococcus porcinus TaxID=1340 RepID=A0A4V0H5I9_STRPO|nr:N-acetyltransferase [Streptococcus porcinus]EGJ26674.1 putative protease synthase and sporulation negative regulatory protein PAI 1 [Streptococcus porcinus str. Jelinkova 176]MBA2795041.1 GNAT family N-acetyltransferase [Streptococcus porcinus]SQG44533.1 GNAT family acetyltransferase [Streptococcus porcinus]VTT44501.1 GNAT family acetyltransferase [Streptococcus porcinus]VTT45823.1 GNAT family acetyltransferase [Streptococcus porcinus]